MTLLPRKRISKFERDSITVILSCVGTQDQGNNSSNQKTELEENHIEEITARKSNFKITEKIEMSQENSTNKSSSNSNIKNFNQFNAQESLKFEGFLELKLRLYP